jgi:hexulose-6-phosphate isomerase
MEQHSFFVKNNLKIIFEIDYNPFEVSRFITALPKDSFGINYDIGNSAALGFNPSEEFDMFGSRVINVHIKDRAFGGSTVPLGKGSANFEAVFRALANLNYDGNYILQTARSSEGNHEEVLRKYSDMTANWLCQYGLGD